MCSTLEIPKCKPSIFALADKWDRETSMFVFSWGEATITLEDVMVLGGFSVTGDSVLTGLHSKELLEIEENLLVARSELLRAKCKKASQQQWMEIWMGKKGAFEHEAFLALWLSRYVLPADDCSTINKSVIQVAVLLSRGNRIALAPAVLASIYRDLRLLKGNIAAIRSLGNQDDGNVSRVNLWAPLQLLQAWFWERFPKLSPKCNPVTKGLCRLERWSKVKTWRNDDVGVIDFAKGNFRWRPYSFDIDLQSYVRCIRVSELVGLDCIEGYFPHRVAMQFGLDQDIPIASRCVSDTVENAWSNYNRPVVDLYMPPKNFESAVTTRYLDWWKKSEAVKESASCGIEKEGLPKTPISAAERMSIKIENNEAEVPPGFIPKSKRVPEEVDESSDQHQPSSKKCKQSWCYPVINIDSSDSDSPPGVSCQSKGVIDSDDDHQTLTELFGLKDSKRENQSGSISLSHPESPLSSAGDNAFMQGTESIKNNSRHILPTEVCTRKGLAVEDGNTSKAVSPIRSSIACKSSDMDLLGRIARLQRVIDLVKSARLGQT